MAGLELRDFQTTSHEPSAHNLCKLEPLADARARANGDAAMPATASHETSTACQPAARLPQEVAAEAQPPSGRASDTERPGSTHSLTHSLQRVPTYLQPEMSFKERLHHFTFAWYTLTMSTSGIALVLGITPHRFRGLDVIGLVIFLFDLVFFLFITSAICFRFVVHRRTFRKAFTHPSEALFIPTFFLSIAALLANTCEYGRLFFVADSGARRGLTRFLSVVFWIYLGVTFLFSVFQYHLLFTVKPQRRLTVSAMTPAWILPIFPVMLAGTLAAVFSPDQAPSQALATLSAGVAAQGLGFLVSAFMYSTYLSRLMAFGLPAQRPGMFIAVGPPSFTCAAFIAMGMDAPRVFTSSDPSAAANVLLSGLQPDGNTASSFSASDAVALAASIRFFALFAAVFLWGLSFWFFASAVSAVIAGMPDRKFHLSWWSFVFPNAGFTIATIRFGDAFSSDSLLWVSSVMTVCLVAAWIFIFVRCIGAVIRREIVWPGHDEDE